MAPFFAVSKYVPWYKKSAALVRMSELYPRHSILTTGEADFRVYRRNQREVIPVICPPSR